MITFQNVTRSFGEKTVLQQLSFSLPENGIVALMGPSGIGKTTLLRLMCGLDRPSSGTVTASTQKVAVSFQEPRLIPWLTCRENVTFVLSESNKGRDDLDELFRLFELSDVKDSLPDTLSGGMQQRVSLIRALAHGADLLLLDEPFSGLDKALCERLFPIIKAANPTGLTVIVTHDSHEAAALGATVLTLSGDPVTELLTATP